MTDVYSELAKHLDSLPAGFPATDSGVEIRILKRLFTPQEAEIAAKLTVLPEPPSAIAKRLNTDAAALSELLGTMSKKGLIFRTSKGGTTLYMAAQFMVGIWEYHVNDLNEDLIRDVNEYIPIIMKKSWLSKKTKQLRVVPISGSVSAGMNIMPYEAAEGMIKSQSKIVVAPCICRREHSMVGKGCDKLKEACLTFGTAATYYEENKLGRIISQEEALEILNKAQEDGLVVQPGNSQRPVNICLCCGCCCQVLKNLKTFDEPGKAVCSNYYAEVNSENCTACGACADKCQMDAIQIEDTAVVHTKKCIGCGLCVTACEFDAIKLIEKPESEKYLPPSNTIEMLRSMSREKEIR